MDLATIIVATLVLVLWLLVSKLLHRNQDWIVTHILCPPEILFLDSAAERGRVSNRALLAFWRRPATWISTLCYVGAATYLVLCLLKPTVALARALPGNADVKKEVGIAFLLIPVLCLGPLLLLQFRRWMRGFLRDYLNEHGMPICRKCGYDLQGLDSPACPECGTPCKNATESD